MMGIIDNVNNKCELLLSLSILAGIILHKSYGKVDILCHNIHINPRIMKVKINFEMCPLPFIISNIDKN